MNVGGGNDIEIVPGTDVGKVKVLREGSVRVMAPEIREDVEVPLEGNGGTIIPDFVSEAVPETPVEESVVTIGP